ncbi:restriction endonuclease subunit S [Flagellimonas abyssi]|uniref:Restriction endonuclease subunit S n=1 Tax=Flagellimonas abyssi TaxID=2864871 RepID=A0ABS7EMV4_9FLAO|nr:restriction endonuclease subunit S [Allomuricauda abyssi]MBW8198900.1 restriction endonuclease subunit S [Allomuricauda abyssi]
MDSKQLPDNWAITKLGVLSNLIRGVSYKKTDASQIKTAIFNIHILRGGNIQDGSIVAGKDEVYVNRELIKKTQFIKKSDVVIVGSTGSKKLIGKAGIALQDYNDTAFGAFLMLARANKKINSNYFAYFFLSKFYRDKIRELAGGVNINNIRKEYINDMRFPLPPRIEQDRIVFKVDTLMAQVQAMQKSLERIPQLLKDFRQQVLTQAVTGKLTEEWRVGKDLEDWRFSKIEDIADSLSGFAFKSKDFVDSGIQLIRMGNLYNNKLDLTRNPVFLPRELDIKLRNKYTLIKGDILLSLTGTKYKRDYGFAIKVDVEEELLLNQRILALRPRINVDYFLYILKDNIFRDQFFSFETGGVNQGNVGSKAVQSIKVKIPPAIEQNEIVSRVEGLFRTLRQIEEKYETLKLKINGLPQAILQKAFKGELVEQLPTEGDAKELLKEIEKLKKS